jgi:hypothetical protein
MSKAQATDGMSTNEYVVNRGIVPSVSTSHEQELCSGIEGWRERLLT